MAPSPSSSAAVLAMLVLLVLLGMGCPAAATPACTDCTAQCNSTCSAANFAGAGPCGADCSRSQACLGCLQAYKWKCSVHCISFCRRQTSSGYDCEGTCARSCSDLTGSCGICAESPTCTACKANYSHGCSSCCTSYCKFHCV
ncbi:hypothetical protein CFC21_085775 [Triticum aestivum]|uniref:Uncharacterized protein n=1 Tax=Triticum aestivum TaxID=4565 RepID=A0A9R1ID65_WHEAT|nr:hypothetical protein CFC21_085775 [Triticum aestivum]